MVSRCCELLGVTCRLHLGLDGALEILPFLFCFDLPLMLPAASGHVLLSLLNLFRVQVMKDSLVPGELVFHVSLVVVF